MVSPSNGILFCVRPGMVFVTRYSVVGDRVSQPAVFALGLRSVLLCGRLLVFLIVGCCGVESSQVEVGLLAG